MHVNNERNFPQAKLDSEINVRFLLNEHGDLHFYCIIIVCKFKRKLKKIIGGKKDIGESVHETVTL